MLVPCRQLRTMSPLVLFPLTETQNSPEVNAALACFTPTALQRLPVPLQTLVHDARWTASSYAELGSILKQWYAGSQMCFYWCHLAAVVISAHHNLRVAQRVICSVAVSALSALAMCTILGVTPRACHGKRPPVRQTVLPPHTQPHPTAPNPTAALRLQLPPDGAIGNNREPTHLQGCNLACPTVTSLAVLGILRMLATVVYLLSRLTTLTLVCATIKHCSPTGPARPVDSTRHIRDDSVNPGSDAPTSMSPPPTTTHLTRTLTNPTLTFGALNVGGVEITPNRLCHLLAGFHPLPHTLSLQDFRPSASSSLRDHERVAMYWGYHLLHSSPSRKAGVALLVHTSIAPHRHTMKTIIDGRLVTTSLQLHNDPSMPPVTVASFYGPHTSRERSSCEKHLDRLARECAIILGDYNAVTRTGHTTALRAPLWPWLIAKERAGSLSDLLIPHQTCTPYTRVRRYAGTRSYLDRAYGTRLFGALFQTSGAQVVDFSSVKGIQDHNPILIHTIPWAQPHIPEARCAQWKRRDVSRFRRDISAATAALPLPTVASDTAHTYQQLCSHMLTAMRRVNSQRPPSPPASDDVSDWSSVVRQLAKQAKRRSKTFYRRIKHTLLTPPAQSTLPTPTRKIQRILQRNTPWSSHALDLIPQRARLCDPPPPTFSELRALARASRKKSPGPDGVPPYLLHILPDPVFQLVHSGISLCYSEGFLPQPWLVSETFCLFKGKGQWQDPDRWRPIAMSNSIYRLFMRWVYSKLYPLVSPHLHPNQFGGRQGTSTAHATQIFLDAIDSIRDKEALLAFDVYHAFDSPPKALILGVLDRMGTPSKLLQIISLVMEQGSTFLRGAEETVFRTTHGVKQGCPLSCFLFVVVFEIPLRVLDQHGIPFSAYVDDICSPAPYGQSQHVAEVVQTALSLIACQVNVTKSESLHMQPLPPVLPTLPKYLHPPSPVQAASPSPWYTVSAPYPPEWSVQVLHTFARAPYLMHLGHPLSPCLCPDACVEVVLQELKAQLNELHSQPIQVIDQVLLVNSMVLPRLLYRTECIPLRASQLMSITSLLEKFIFGVMGLPSLVAKKTLYTHRSRGLGLGYFPILHPTRVLDSLHRNQRLHTLSTSPHTTVSPYHAFITAVSLLNPDPDPRKPPVHTTWAAQQLQRDAVEVAHVAGLTVYLLPPQCQPPATYTDGSKMGQPPSSGASAVLKDGRIAVCRVPGDPNSYKAELVGMLLGSHFSEVGDTIRLDCQGAIASAQSARRPVRQAFWVQEVRTSILAKCQGLELVEGHTGEVHNEMSDKYAKVCMALPLPPPQTRVTPWDVVRHGERMAPPHKVWTHGLFPTHTHEGFHPLSWRPLRFRRLAWHKWLFGLQSRLGYAHYATFWTHAPVKHPCPHCHRFHNQSLHGTLAFCTQTHPLVAAWLSS